MSCTKSAEESRPDERTHPPSVVNDNALIIPNEIIKALGNQLISPERATSTTQAKSNGASAWAAC